MQVQCPNCNKVYDHVPEAMAGHKTLCRACKKQFVVPSEVLSSSTLRKPEPDLSEKNSAGSSPGPKARDILPQNPNESFSHHYPNIPPLSKPITIIPTPPLPVSIPSNHSTGSFSSDHTEGVLQDSATSIVRQTYAYPLMIRTFLVIGSIFGLCGFAYVLRESSRPEQQPPQVTSTISDNLNSESSNPNSNAKSIDQIDSRTEEQDPIRIADIPAEPDPNKPDNQITKNPSSKSMDSDDFVELIAALLDPPYRNDRIPRQIESEFFETVSRIESENERAATFAALCRVWGVGTNQEQTLGRQRLIESAERGEPTAMKVLAKMYLNGIVFPIDPEKCFEIIKKSRRSGQDTFAIDFARSLLTGSDGRDTLSAATRILEDLGKDGNYDATALLAELLLFDKDESNDKSIIPALESGAKAGHPACMGLLGHFVLTSKSEREFDAIPGKSVRESVEQAIGLIQNAAQAGSIQAQADLGNILMNGYFGVARDESQAVTWLRKAANSGLPSAMVMLGMYESQKGRREAARKYFENAMHAGEEEGAIFLSQIDFEEHLANRDFRKATESFELLIALADSGAPTAKYLAARILARGVRTGPSTFDRWIVRPAPEKAFGYCESAAETNHPAAMRLLADFHSNGIGTAVSKQQANRWRTRADRANNLMRGIGDSAR